MMSIIAIINGVVLYFAAYPNITVTMIILSLGFLFVLASLYA